MKINEFLSILLLGYFFSLTCFSCFTFNYTYINSFDYSLKLLFCLDLLKSHNLLKVTCEKCGWKFLYALFMNFYIVAYILVLYFLIKCLLINWLKHFILMHILMIENTCLFIISFVAPLLKQRIIKFYFTYEYSLKFKFVFFFNFHFFILILSITLVQNLQIYTIIKMVLMKL